MERVYQPEFVFKLEVGDTVHVNNIGAVTLTNYQRAGTVAARQKLTSVKTTLTITESNSSTNGTFLNGKRLTPGKSEPIRSGDTLLPPAEFAA